MDNTIYKELTYTVRIKGKGESKEHAVVNALGKIKQMITSQLNGLIIRIEPLKAEVIEAVEEVYIEKFFFFFFPRKRSIFKVEMDILVRLFILDIKKVEFKKAQIERS